MLLLTMVVPKGVAVIILAWIGTISCSIAFGAGYTYTKVSLVLTQISASKKKYARVMIHTIQFFFLLFEFPALLKRELATIP